MNRTTLFFSIVFMAFSISALAQDSPEPWKPEQLLSPIELSSILSDSIADQPLIIDIGPAGLIKGAIETGPAGEKNNFKKLKALLEKENRDRKIVIYCGCCPFKNCPNIRPAFSLLNSMKFTNQYLLDLPHNLKADWIDPGFPLDK